MAARSSSSSAAAAFACIGCFGLNVFRHFFSRKECEVFSAAVGTYFFFSSFTLESRRRCCRERAAFSLSLIATGDALDSAPAVEPSKAGRVTRAKAD